MSGMRADMQQSQPFPQRHRRVGGTPRIPRPTCRTAKILLANSATRPQAHFRGTARRYRVKYVRYARHDQLAIRNSPAVSAKGQSRGDIRAETALWQVSLMLATGRRAAEQG